MSIEQGEYANVRRVGDEYCSGRRPAVPSGHIAEAERCDEAKKLLLMAQGQQEVDAAAKKVEVLCRFER